MQRLSSDIIAYRLSQLFDVRWAIDGDTPVELDLPRCWTGTPDDLGRVVVVAPEQRPLFDRLARRKPVSPPEPTLFVLVGGAEPSRRMVRPGTMCLMANGARHDDAAAATIGAPAGTPTAPHGATPAPHPVSDALFFDVFNAVLDVFRLFDDWGRAMREAAAGTGVFQRLVDSCELVLDDPLCIIDEEFNYAAYSRSSAERGVIASPSGVDAGLSDSVLLEYRSLPNMHEMSMRPRAFTHQFTFGDSVIRNLFFDGRNIGHLSMRTTGDDQLLCRYKAAVLDYLGPEVERAYGRFRTLHRAEDPLAHVRQLASQSLDGPAPLPDEWTGALEQLGWLAEEPMCLIQLLPDLRNDEPHHAKRMAVIVEERWGGCLTFEHDDRPLVLVNLQRFEPDQGSGLKQALSYLVRDNLMTAGISRPFAQVSRLRAAYVQTRAALDAGARIDPYAWVYSFDDYALPYLLHAATQQFPEDRAALACEPLLVLRDHDAKRGTRYVETLRTLLACKMNASETARALFVHRSTLLARLERMQKLAAIDFDDPDAMFYLALSLRMID